MSGSVHVGYERGESVQLIGFGSYGYFRYSVWRGEGDVFHLWWFVWGGSVRQVVENCRTECGGE